MDRQITREKLGELLEEASHYIDDPEWHILYRSRVTTVRSVDKLGSSLWRPYFALDIYADWDYYGYGAPEHLRLSAYSKIKKFLEECRSAARKAA